MNKFWGKNKKSSSTKFELFFPNFGPEEIFKKKKNHFGYSSSLLC